MNRTMIKIISLGLAAQMMATLMSGCGKTAAEDLPLVSQLSKKELADYYAKQLDYDTVVVRNTDVDYTKYELQDVPSNTLGHLENAIAETEAVLKLNKYEYSTALAESDWVYIKTLLNDKKLTGGEITQAKQALGFYFVDKTYDVSSMETLGEFTSLTPLVGVHGAFSYNDLQGDTLNDPFMNLVAEKLNTYYQENNIDASLSYANGELSITENGETSIVSVSSVLNDAEDKGLLNDLVNDTSGASSLGGSDNTADGETPTDTEQTTEDGNTTSESTSSVTATEDNKMLVGQAPGDELVSGGTASSDATESTSNSSSTSVTSTETSSNTTSDTTNDESTSNSDSTDTNSGETTGTSAPTQGNYNGMGGDYTNEVRSNILNTSLINKLVGAGVYQSAYMPNLDLVYTTPAASGAIDGIGILPMGSLTLQNYGYSRDDMNGTMTLRYIYKTDIKTGEIYNVNVYCTSFTNNTTVTNTGDTVLVPDFVESELSQLVERADRIIINNDLPGLMGQTVFKDVGVGILAGYKHNYVNDLRRISTIRNIMSRDISGNSYMLEVETFVEEGSKDSDVSGTYIDTYYYMVEQIDGEFYITDMALTSRTMQREPDINPDDVITMRKIALNLSGEVDDTYREGIRFLADNLWQSCTNRILTGAFNGTDGVEYSLGMRECFDSDVTLLSSDDKGYYVSQLVDVVGKYGNNNKVEFNGAITQWIGGNSNQVEFTTEELVTYSNSKDAVYMTVYYLVSNYKDSWVIDQRTVLSTEVVDGANMDAIYTRLANG